MTTEQTLRKLAGNHIFAVKFIKRTTGELREMRCRFNVRKHVNGKGRSFDPSKKGLIPVYDVQVDGHRMIPLEGILEITVDGQTYKF